MTAKTSRVQLLDALQERLNDLHRSGMGWRAIARQIYPGVPPGTLCAIAKHRRYPRSNAYCAILGLPTRRIVYANPPARRWRDLPPEALAWAMENRQEMT